MQRQDTHSKVIGYLLWIFGFLGAHRFYYGKPVTGTIWFFTLGLFFIGWIIDLFLIPSMDREADLRFTAGDTDYNVAWILLTFLGVFGVHRMYQGKWITGIIYLFKPQLDAWMYTGLMQVPVAEQRLSADQQLAIVREAYPQAAARFRPACRAPRPCRT